MTERQLVARTLRDLEAALRTLRVAVLGRIADVVRLDPGVIAPGAMGAGRLEILHLRRLTDTTEILVDRFGRELAAIVAQWIPEAATLGQETVDRVALRALRAARRHEALQEALSHADRGLLRTLGIAHLADTVGPEILDLFVPELVTNLTTETRLALGRVLRRGVLAQASPFTIMRDVRTTLGSTSSRAEMIVRTELGRTVNAATHARGAQYDEQVPDLNLRKRWLATLDDRTRPAHRTAHEVTARNPIPITDDFWVGGERLRYPVDPKGSARNTIACRCREMIVAPTLEAA
jgi:hypothetical protein